MNLSQVMSMSKESLRIEIAKLQGATIEQDSSERFIMRLGDNKFTGFHMDIGFDSLHIPDYPNDIKAAWELEGMIPGELKPKYAEILTRLVDEQENYVSQRFQLAHSTPHQKSMAFYMTMGEQ